MQSNLAEDKNQSCKRCGSHKLITKIEPPHVALRCKDCGAWQQWVSKSKARAITAQSRIKTYPQTPEVIQPDFNQSLPSKDCRAEVQELRREIDKINSVLLVHTRILGQGPAPRQVKEFSREITDEQIADFGRAVGGEG